MAILETDIKLLASARMTDTPDGGGRMTGNVIQSGVDNNLFDDVSNLDRVYGRVSLRKMFAGVLTNTTDKYLGARAIIDAPPADEHIDGVLFGASSLFDTREEAKVKVEAYMSRGPAADYYLFSDHIEGQSVLLLAGPPARDQPNIGAVIILRRAIDSTNSVEQYCKITTVSSTVATFDVGLPSEFELRISTCGISDPLRADYPGWGGLRDGWVSPDRMLLSENANRSLTYAAVVADAAEYFGIRPLAAAAAVGSFSLKADSTFSPLLPSAQIETPLSFLQPYSIMSFPVPVYDTLEYVASHVWSTTTALSLPGGCLPGSLSIETEGLTITDTAGKLMRAGSQIGAIDYVNGVLSLSTGTFSGSKAISYKPAARLLRAPQSTEIPVTIESRSRSYVGTATPTPQPGTLTVSYMSGGMWYSLADSGDGALRGAEVGYGAGTFNASTGAYVVTFGALPDVSSSVIVTWGVPTQETAHPTATLKASQLVALVTATGEAVQPGTMTVSWPLDGVTQTAAVAVDGTISGAATGTVSNATSTITLSPNVLPAVGTLFTVACTVGPKHEDTFAHPSRDGNGKVPVTASASAIVPGSLEVEWNTVTDVAVLGVYSREQMQEMGVSVPLDPTQVAKDDGAGVIKLNGVAIGTINYSTGAVLFMPDVEIKIPRPRYTSAPAGSASHFRMNYAGIEYVPAPSTYPNDTSGYVKLRYNSAGSSSNLTSTFTFTPSFRLLTDVQAAVVPGSVLLSAPGAQPWGDNGLGVLRESTPSGWVTRGSIDYLTGAVTLSSWVAGTANSLTRAGCVTTVGENISSEYVFRTPNAPLRPGLLSISFARSVGGAQTVTADTSGILSGLGVTGSVDYEYGIVRVRFGETVAAAGKELEPWYSASAVDGSGNIFKPVPVAASTVRYSAVAYSYMPLDADILGLDPVRLPSDGRVPIFKTGRVLVVHNTVKIAPQNVSNGQTVNCGRVLLARIRVFGNDGLEITSGFTKNLDAGTITFTNVAGMSQPVVIEHRIEDEALCADAQITGDLRLTRPLTHSYPADTSYVSSAYVVGTLQAAAQDSFAQTVWTDAWSDARIGAPLLAQYDDTAHPIVVTNAGAITERWLIQFTSNTTFNLIGEEVGQIITGDTATPLAPVNPATGVPYFTLQSSGWGTGWVAGNCLRFNTSGANFPLWVARTVRQSPSAAPGTDQMTISIRGDIDQ